MKNVESEPKSGSDLLRYHRTRLGLSQSDLAQKAGMDRSNLANVEAGRRSTGREIAKRLAKVLGVNDYRLLM